MTWKAAPRSARTAGRRRLLVLGIPILVVAALATALVRRPGKAPTPAGATRPIRVEVLNGCGVPGVAERVASRLREGRFLVERTGNAAEFGHTEDLVVARTGDRTASEEVASFLSIDTRLVQRNETADVDVTVIVGRPH
jgi:hypothetical protein